MCVDSSSELRMTVLRILDAPAVTDNIRIAHHSTLTHHAERKRSLFAEQLQLFAKCSLDIGFALVEQLDIHEIGGNVREHAHLACPHFVTHRDGGAYHIVDLAAADQRPNILHHGAIAHQHVAEHADLVHKSILDNAVAHEAIVNACRERDIARQQERPIERRQANVAHKDGIADAAGGEVRINQHARPVLTTVAVLLQGGDFFSGEGAELSAVGLRRLQTFGERRQNAVLQHFFQFEQTLHTQKID